MSKVQTRSMCEHGFDSGCPIGCFGDNLLPEWRLASDKIKAERIDYADRFNGMLREAGITGYAREYHFAAVATGGTGRGMRARLKAAGLRDWRFDFAFVEQRLAIEVDGGTRQTGVNPITGEPIAVGRHAMSDDYRKINAAQLLGWRVLRYTLEMLRSGEWDQEIRSALTAKA